MNDTITSLAYLTPVSRIHRRPLVARRLTDPIRLLIEECVQRLLDASSDELPQVLVDLGLVDLKQFPSCLSSLYLRISRVQAVLLFGSVCVGPPPILARTRAASILKVRKLQDAIKPQETWLISDLMFF
jgi:hypothetical protein